MSQFVCPDIGGLEPIEENEEKKQENDCPATDNDNGKKSNVELQQDIHEDLNERDAETTPIEQEMQPPKKKKKRKQTTASRGPTALSKKRGNGFEEYFADPPMTPKEALEEKTEIYAPNLPFEERMQSCIQRFRSRRRLQGVLTFLFSEYLFLGGVDSNPSSFTGLGRDDLKDLTPAQRSEATATDVIYGTSSAGDRFYNGDKEAWSVDFTGVAAGFLSVTLLQITTFDLEKIKAGIGMVENFLRYILHHDVCPEYDGDVKEALKVCDAARTEWPMLKQLYASLPGHFNLAAAELFTGEEAKTNWSFQIFSPPEDFDAKSVFYSTLALMDEPGLFDRLTQDGIRVVKKYESTLEVVDIFRPSEDIAKQIKSLAIAEKAGSLVPVGKVTFKPAIIEDDWEQPALTAPDTAESTTLFFDDAMLENMRPGMKMTLTLCELNVGFKFVQAIGSIVPSFYVYLPQEMMRHYKQPKANDRPAPSIHDPDAEEKQFLNDAREG